MACNQLSEENQSHELPLHLDCLLDGIHEENLHSEIDTGPSVGKEET